MSQSPFDILIIGAGPAGLSCAIEAKKAGLSHIVLDKGSVVDAIRRFPHQLVFFSTPDLLEIGGVPFVTAGLRPTRIECIKYYLSVAKYYHLDVRVGQEVKQIAKKGDIFLVETPSQQYEARNVVIATGYFDHPNPFDVPGAQLPHVRRYYSEPYEFAGRRVVVVGGKNSAVEIALDLFRHGASVSLIHRGMTLSDGVKYWILPDIENRIKNGEIVAYFETEVVEILADAVRLRGKHALELPCDAVFVMIGYRPDNSLLRKAGVDFDAESLAPLHDAETMQTNVHGLFVAGSIAAGKYNNKIFIENGRLHGVQIVRHIKNRR
jgi:thioredoxin reductase (NADPH)